MSDYSKLKVRETESPRMCKNCALVYLLYKSCPMKFPRGDCFTQEYIDYALALTTIEGPKP